MSVEIPVSTISRKRFIAGGLAALAEFAIACSGEPILFFPKDQSPKVEKRTAPQEGDIVKYGTRYFLIRFNTYYPIPDIDFYKRATDFDKYGRQKSDLTGRPLPQIAAGRLPEFEIDVEEITKNVRIIKDLKREGGTVIDFDAGFGTSEEEETADFTGYDLTNDPNHGTFYLARRDLRKKGWIFADYHNNRYGKTDGFYDWRDTAKPLDENIREALRVTELKQRLSPLTQRHRIDHSLGANFGLEVAMAHPDWFNVLIFINPVFWLDDVPPELVRRHLRVAQDLVKRSSKESKERIKTFVERFKKEGKVLKIIRAEDDPWASKIEGIEEVDEVLMQSSGRVSNPLEAHGRPLKDKRIAEFIAEVIGQKISS